MAAVDGILGGGGGEVESNRMPVKEQVVHSDPEIMGGELVFVGTRVPVYNLFDYLEAGDSLDEFLEQFPSVTREQAIAALELAREAVVGAESSR